MHKNHDRNDKNKQGNVLPCGKHSSRKWTFPSSRLAVFCCGLALVNLTHAFTGLCLVIGLYPWSNPKWYCWMGHINPVWPSGAIQCHRSAINWTSVDLSSLGFCGIHLSTISQEVPTMSIRKMSLKNTLIKLLSRWQWVNALTTHNIPPRKQSTAKRYAYAMGCSQVHGRYVSL